jgi:hypothetical protein
MRRILPFSLLALTLVPACELFEQKVSKDKLEAELAKWLKDHDLEASKITCPDNQKMEKGNVFECSCIVADIEVPVRVEVTDPAEGTVEWTTKYTTVTDDTIERDVPNLPELAGRNLTIDCTTAVLVSVPQSKWTCDVTDIAAGNLAMVLTITFEDGEGTYGWTLEPKA